MSWSLIFITGFVRKLNFGWVLAKPFRTSMSFSFIKQEKCRLSQLIKFEIVSPHVGSIMLALEHGQNVDLQDVTSISCRAKVHATLAVQVQANKHKLKRKT
jgi:hypothetical protein